VKTLIDIGKIPCTLISVDIFQREQRSKEYLQLYPVGKIPVLQHGDFTLGESGAIMIYLFEIYPHLKHLIGTSLEQRSIVNQFISWYQSQFRLALFKPIRLYLGAVMTQKPIL
jgi:glutathione S-transferase